MGTLSTQRSIKMVLSFLLPSPVQSTPIVALVPVKIRPGVHLDETVEMNRELQTCHPKVNQDA